MRFRRNRISNHELHCFFSKGNGQQVELLDSIVWLVVDTGSGQHTLALVLVVRKNVSKQSSRYLGMSLNF